MAELARHEQWSREAIEACQLDRVNQLWRHAVARTTYYRRMAEEYRLPDQFQSLAEFRERVPVLTKETVRARHQEFLDPGHGAGHWHYTGGSTGTPTGVFWSKTAHLEMLRAKYRFYDAWGVDVFDRMVFVWGHAASFAPGWKGRLAKWRRPLEDGLRNRLRLSAYRLGPEECRDHLRRIAAFRPSAIYAYSSAAWLLATEALQTGWTCPGLKFVNLTAEPAYPHIVAAVELAFGVPAINEYGSAECGFVAGEAPDRTLRVREDIVLVETLPNADGRFDIVQTVLTNRAFPLLRYDIGDVTDAPLHTPQTGFAILENVAGRSNDSLVCRSGRRLHPVWFMTVLDQSSAVRRYRIHQRSDGAVSAELELLPQAPPLDIPQLARRIREQLEGYPVSVTAVDRVEQTAAGKHRWISSELSSAAGAGQGSPTGDGRRRPSVTVDRSVVESASPSISLSASTSANELVHVSSAAPRSEHASDVMGSIMP
jgi:phenylacetate-coenzyme A ligase PaaK-like adenylate-forming protein